MSDLFTDEPLPKEDLFTDAPAPEHSWSQFGHNAVEGIKKPFVAAGTLAKDFATDLPKFNQTLEAMPQGLLNEAKRIGGDELVTKEAPFIHPINAGKKFGQAFYDDPVATTLDVAPFIPKMGEAASVAEKVAPAAEDVTKAGNVAEDVSRVAPKAPSPINLGDEAAQILKEAPKPPEPPPVAPPPVSTGESILDAIEGRIKNAVKDPMQQVNDYIAKEYQNVAKQPGAADIAANYLKEHSQNMNLKELGAAPGQVRKIGVERAHELADYAEKNGLVGIKQGTQGREAMLKKSLEDSGGAVGAFRKMATDRGAIHDPQTLINQVKANLDPKYLKQGMYSGQKGSYLKALEELKKTDGSAQAISDKVTEMFKEAKSQNPLNKPTGPIADVARQVRSINHDLIAQHLSPEEMTLYEKSLEDYGALTQINEFAKRRASTEAGGRLGPGSGISRAAVQKFLDAFGYRTEAKIAGKLSDLIRRNPEILSKPKDLFRSYIDEAAEAVHEMGDVAH